MAFLGQDPPDEEWPFEWPFPAFYCPVCVEERFAVKRGAATYT
jgi:hypothetical protein